MNKQNEMDLKDYDLLKEMIDSFLEDHPNLFGKEDINDIYLNLFRASDTFCQVEEDFPDLQKELENITYKFGLDGEPEDYPEREDPYIDEDYKDSPKEFMVIFADTLTDEVSSYRALTDQIFEKLQKLPEVIKNSRWGKCQGNDWKYNQEIVEGLELFLTHLKEQITEL